MFRNISNVFLSSVISCVLLATTLTVRANDWPENNVPNPVLPEAMGVFMANGIFDGSDPDYLAPTAEDFDEVIMGRDEVGKLLRRQEAVDYFIERYGVDFSFSDFAQNGNIILLHNYQDPRWNYRAYNVPGHSDIPKSGLIVHDTQYVMFVIGTEATLHGSWGGVLGTTVPGGTAAVDGEYLIQGTNRFTLGHPRNIYIRFQSTSPIFGADSGRITFDCRLEHESLGKGLALGRQELYQLEDGRTQVSIANVLQFPATKWAGEQDASLNAE
jgi:hypothetical protein